MDDATDRYASDPAVRKALDELYRAMVAAASRPRPPARCPDCGTQLSPDGTCPHSPFPGKRYLTK
jgi:hypothetical protein